MAALKILSIDDSRVVHSLLREIFLAIKADVTDAFDGPSGFEILANGAAFDVIFLDWEMPKWDGIETLKRIRGLGIKTPVIMLTTKNAPELISLAIETGADEYAMKPFVADVLYDKIESVLGRPVR